MTDGGFSISGPAVDRAEMASLLQIDPVLQEYARHMLRRAAANKDLRIDSPIIALGEKRFTAYAVLTGQTQIVGPEAKKDFLDLWKFIYDATVVYVTQAAGKILSELSRKVAEAYQSSYVKPTPRAAPYPTMWLTCETAIPISFNDGRAPISADAILLVAGCDTGYKQMFVFNGHQITVLPLNAETNDALVIFLEEKIASNTPFRLPRQMGKQVTASGGRGDERVNVIDLRIIPGSGAGTHTGQHGGYHHQWLVSGHARNQWFPADGVHRLKWIGPYIKGPEGTPFKESVRRVAA